MTLKWFDPHQPILEVSPMSAMKKTLVSAAAVAAAVGGTFSVVSPAAAADFPLVATCGTTNGQHCPDIPKNSVNTFGPLVMQFTASTAGCSSLSVQILVDGVPRSLNVLSPGQQTPAVRAWVPSGTHEVAVQAVGVKGGCNSGTLTAWSGKLNVLTNVDALMAS
jgi:hypothetical protein